MSLEFVSLTKIPPAELAQNVTSDHRSLQFGGAQQAPRVALVVLGFLGSYSAVFRAAFRSSVSNPAETA